MNNEVHPIFQPILSQLSNGLGVSATAPVSPVVSPALPSPERGAGRVAVARVSAALSDWAVLDEMKTVLRQHLSAALLECSALACDLTDLDPDQLLVDLRSEFDPSISTACIQDCFSDAFHEAFAQVRHGEPLARVKTLPSGSAI